MAIAEELQFRTGKLWQIVGKSGDQRRGKLLYRIKEEVGRVHFELKSIEGRKLRVEGSLAELWYFLIG